MNTRWFRRARLKNVYLYSGEHNRLPNHISFLSQPKKYIQRMKKLMMIAAMAFVSTLAFAQDDNDVAEELKALQTAFGKDKAELVKQYMAIPADKDADFWSVYDQYEAARKTLGKSKAQLIMDYASSYANLDDKKAADLLKRKADLSDEFTKLQRKFYPQFSKAVGGVQAAKFFQLEDYLNNVINLGIQNNIPFIGEIDKSKIQSGKN